MRKSKSHFYKFYLLEKKKTAVNVDQPDLVNFSNLLNKVNVFPLWKQELAVTTCIKLNQNNAQ